jgi:hypothetical protein
MKLKSLKDLLYLILIATLALAGCGAPGSASVALREVQDYWEQTVALENLAEADWLAMVTARSEYMRMIQNQLPIAFQCYKNSGDVFQQALEGRYDNVDPTGRSTGEVNTPFMMQALVVNENYPNLDKCQGIDAKMADAVVVWRTKNVDNANKLYDDKQDLDTKYYGDLGRALAVKLLQLAGDEFMKSEYAARFQPPRVWFPTFNLQAFVTDKAQCYAFAEEYPGQAVWSNSLQRCDLIGAAAYAIIFRPILAQATLNEINTGVDESNPVEMPGQPTTQP